jgi:hypothetical protein
LMGRNRFDELEQEAFCQAVEEALSSETTPALVERVTSRQAEPPEEIDAFGGRVR